MLNECGGWEEPKTRLLRGMVILLRRLILDAFERGRAQMPALFGADSFYGRRCSTRNQAFIAEAFR